MLQFRLVICKIFYFAIIEAKAVSNLRLEQLMLHPPSLKVCRTLMETLRKLKDIIRSYTSIFSICF